MKPPRRHDPFRLTPGEWAQVGAYLWLAAMGLWKTFELIGIVCSWLCS